MNGQSLGSCEYGETFTFIVSNRDSDGAAIAGFTPAYFDVFDTETGTKIVTNDSLTLISGATSWYGSIDTTGTDFEARKTYAIKIKTATTADPTTFLLYSFTVTGSYSDRLARLLALNGENIFIDNLSYNTGGKMTGCRIRVFDTSTNATAASSGNTDLEPGELYQYSVTQVFSSGVQRRTSHLSVLDTSLDTE
jgi:hypothetical protein